MKALMLKDTYVLWKQARFFLVLILVFALLPSSFNSTFAVVYAAMLPYTAMAYDERSRWDQLAMMMPYADRDIVLSKYVLGWLLSLGAAALTLLCQTVLFTIRRSTFPAPSAAVAALAFCASVCILAISLPLMFRFGVERGRMVMFLVIFLTCGTAGALGALVEAAENSGLFFPAFVVGALPIAAAVLTAVSVPLSMRAYRRRSA